MDVLSAISADHVRSALARIDRDGVPSARTSTRFCLVADGRHYPPKYVVALAARSSLGRDLRPDEFSGGVQTNAALTKAGFGVDACTCRGKREPVPARALASKSRRKAVTPNSMPSATIVRLTSLGRTPGHLQAEEEMLLDAFGRHWPRKLRTKFVVTPGGFVHGRWPSSWNGRTGWDSRKTDTERLIAAATRQLAKVVTPKVYAAAVGKAEVLTIGIDLSSPDDVGLAELVAVIDIEKRAIVRWTGKSYPTPGQEHTLVHVVDLDTHLVEIAGERVLVLGCHDLNMFSPRARANQSPDGPRRGRCDAMKRAVARFKPTVVLQHPHSTDTPNIWRMPWLSLARDVPSVRVWASGIGYYSRRGKPRADLEKVLNQTRSSAEDVRELILDAGRYV